MTNINKIKGSKYYNDILEKRIEKHMLRSELDIESGRTVSAKEVFKYLKGKYEF